MTKIDPGKVPQRKLFTGALMPAVGMGTFGSDHVSAQEVSQAVAGAVEAGYRSFDCAAIARIPVNRLVMPIGLLIYVVVLTIVTAIKEKQYAKFKETLKNNKKVENKE